MTLALVHIFAQATDISTQPLTRLQDSLSVVWFLESNNLYTYCNLWVKHGLQCLNLNTGIPHMHTVTWCCTVQSKCFFFLMEICFYFWSFFVTLIITCYDWTTTCMISITTPHCLSMVHNGFKANSALKGMVFLWILNNSGSVVLTC